MLAKVLSSAVMGIDAYVVEVEVDISQGLPSFSTVGLPEGAVRESKERVKAAVKNAGYHFPSDRITVNLAPADVKKEGSGFDLPMAVGILAATGIVPKEACRDHLILGELSLDGFIRPIKGALPMAMAAKENGLGGVFSCPWRTQPKQRWLKGSMFTRSSRSISSWKPFAGLCPSPRVGRTAALYCSLKSRRPISRMCAVRRT